MKKTNCSTPLLIFLSLCFWSCSAQAQSFSQSQSVQHYPNGNVKSITMMGAKPGEPYLQTFYEDQDGVLKAEMIYDAQRQATIIKQYNLSGRLISTEVKKADDLHRVRSRPRIDPNLNKPYEPYVRKETTSQGPVYDKYGVPDQFTPGITKIKRVGIKRFDVPDEPKTYVDYQKNDCYDKDDLSACYRVGEVYLSEGKVTAARFWFKWACNEGNKDGCQQYETLTESLRGEGEEEAEYEIIDDHFYLPTDQRLMDLGADIMNKPRPVNTRSQGFRTQEIKCDELQVGYSCYRVSKFLKDSNPVVSDYYLQLGCEYEDPTSCEALEIPLQHTQSEIISERVEDNRYLLKKKDKKGAQTFGAVMSPMQETKMREESNKRLLQESLDCLRGRYVGCPAPAYQFSLREDYEMASLLLSRACKFTNIADCEQWAEHELKLGNVYHHKRILQYLCAFGNYCRGIKKHGYEPLDLKPCRAYFRETKPEMLKYVAKKYKSGIPRKLVVQDVRPPVLILGRDECKDYCREQKQKQVKKNPINIFSASCNFGSFGTLDEIFREYID